MCSFTSLLVNIWGLGNTLRRRRRRHFLKLHSRHYLEDDIWIYMKQIMHIYGEYSLLQLKRLLLINGFNLILPLQKNGEQL